MWMKRWGRGAQGAADSAEALARLVPGTPQEEVAVELCAFLTASTSPAWAWSPPASARRSSACSSVRPPPRPCYPALASRCAARLHSNSGGGR